MGRVYPFLVVAVLGLALPAWGDENTGIVATGISKVEVPPDQLTVSLSVASFSRDVAEATSMLKERTDAAATAVARKLAAAVEVHIGPYTITTETPNDGKRAAGGGYRATGGSYNGTCAISLILKDLAKYKQLVDVVAKLEGVDLGTPYYGRSDMESLRDKALVNAIAEARRKANMMAEASGVKLGAVLAVEEEPIEDGLQPNVNETQMETDVAGVPEPQPAVVESSDDLGLVVVRASVKLRYEIKK